ncbi:hypothetical protein O6P43_015645 [Quillaja saponaria]|uniref:Uncharacterized protein n=1 Tax=Quillaja saponaria TaxID=32244 RepID=A0AAD7LXH1_QUISA|nr:hypothetical protein O6P43_015645 [Quillaja saponaria]
MEIEVGLVELKDFYVELSFLNLVVELRFLSSVTSICWDACDDVYLLMGRLWPVILPTNALNPSLSDLKS